MIAAGVSTALYLVYARRAPSGPSGGSWPGLAFGFAGFGMMIFATLLSGRRKLRAWRLGRGTSWLKGHIWLGLLAIPMILFHGGLSAGGPLTTTLLVLLFAVTGSGVIGLVLQQFMPRAMSEMVPLETIYDEIPHVCEQLRAESDRLVVSVCGELGLPRDGEPGEDRTPGRVRGGGQTRRSRGSMGTDDTDGTDGTPGAGRTGEAGWRSTTGAERAGRSAQALRETGRAGTAGAGIRSSRGPTPTAALTAQAAVVATAAPAAEPVPGSGPLREFYVSRLRPYLAPGGADDAELGRREYARGLFDRLRTFLPPSLAGTLEDLAEICEERRQLRVQSRMHGLMHGWLYVHVPLTAALMVLSLLHAVWAMRY